MPEACRRLGTVAQASKLAGVSPAIVRRLLREGRITGVRVAGGNFQVDLETVEALVVEYPRRDLDERVRQIIDAAPELSDAQVNRLRLVFESARQRKVSTG
jgi:excisionase family DNA binding protein